MKKTILLLITVFTIFNANAHIACIFSTDGTIPNYFACR